MDDNHYKAFCDEVRVGVKAILGERMAEVEAAQEAMFSRMRGYNTAGMSFPTSSFSVHAIRDHFHLNIPSRTADEATIAAVKGVVSEASERHGVELDIGKDVRGGSNYVLEGRLKDAPSPAPGM